MKKLPIIVISFFLLALPLSSTALADEYSDATKVFKEAEASGALFDNCYGYAIFPTIGKGGFGIGGAHGDGRVYEHGTYVGDTSMTQVTIGFQVGGQAFTQIIFFQNKDAFTEYTSGEFEFGAQASAVAITAGAQASTSTAGTSAGASSSDDSVSNAGGYEHGMAIFTVAKGGLMYEASVGGQKFKYEAKK
jgi:lipid-binding SYLF domain-containing protein